jgi:phenylalanine-4-hydroxylase
VKLIPDHLKKYIVEQHYEKYTPVDQACWRYILRQLKNFLSKHAHESYLVGLEKTGVEIEQIPRIEDISKKLEKFGWRALPVSGFIPPAAFMELQSLSVLPIASDMRTIDHLLYTPAPDIVHEAAGHAPILVDPDFAAYLRQYAQTAKKALISKEDLDLYNAIRELSDIKEKAGSTSQEIEAAQAHLNQVTRSMSHVSEASELSRMNWWTAEYGLIGDIENPRIFGAGLLSSVGESRWCLSEKVKKIPLTVDCLQFSYDITEPQPQLFVAPDFKTLSKTLEQVTNKMAFRLGGLEGVEKAIRARTVNTVELNSGLQISGQFTEVLKDKTQNDQQPIYLRTTGPSQLCYNEQELPGHGPSYHAQGFGTPLGPLKKHPQLCPSLLSDQELSNLGIQLHKVIEIEFLSGVKVQGRLEKTSRRDGKLVLMSFSDCRVTYQGRVLFDPAWGVFDMGVGSKVVSVFAGPADKIRFGEVDDFVAARVPQRNFSTQEKLMHNNYAQVRAWREQKISGTSLDQLLKKLLDAHTVEFPNDWLLPLEAFELLMHRQGNPALAQSVKQRLVAQSQAMPHFQSTIMDGIDLACDHL